VSVVIVGVDGLLMGLLVLRRYVGWMELEEGFLEDARGEFLD